jgi:UDP-N-acetylmuramoyl-tripeptide--D-alanyl-D-alanine ligase
MIIEKIHALYLNCSGVSTDTRKINWNSMFFALKGDNFDGNTFTVDALKLGAKCAIIDNEAYASGSNTILVEDVLQTLQSLARYHRTYLGTKIIALTGSNGKTTTKELINAVLSKKYKTTATAGNLNNHIGVPLTLLSMTKETELGLVEMGANHQKEIAFLCNIALPDFGYITNFGKAHLEGFGGVQGVIKGKSEMYSHLVKHNKSAFVNSDDPIQLEKTKEVKSIKFGIDSKPDNIVIELISSEPYVKVKYMNMDIDSNLIGSYNFGNISAAIAMGNYFNVSDDDIKSAIESYTPQNNRSQIIEKNSNKIFLDAYNANPTSMEAALQNFYKQNEENKIIILGDMFELGSEADKEHKHIVEIAQEMSFNSNFFIGENFYRNKIDNTNFLFYKSFDDFKQKIEASKFDEALILIKGSRGMALERVLELID